MSELPELPEPPRRTRPVPAGGLEAAINAGRGRRHRALAAAGGATTVLALVAMAVLDPMGGRSESLQYVDPPSPPPAPTAPASPEPTDEPRPEQGAQASPEAGLQVAVPTTTPRPSAPLGAGGPAATSAPAPAGPAAPTPPADDDTADGDTANDDTADDGTAEDGRRGPAPTSDPSASPRSRPAYREDTDEDAEGSLNCSPSRTNPGGTCSYASGGAMPEVVRRGERAVVSYGECAGSDDIGDRVYGFDSGQEKELVAVAEDGEREVFRFSATVTYSEGAHERRLRPGRCIEWTATWRLTTTDGAPVPAGTYRLELTVSPDRYEYENAAEGVDEDPEPMRAQVRVQVVD